MTHINPQHPDQVMPGAGSKLIELSKQLSRLLRKENKLLERKQTKEAQKNSGEKVRLTAEYRKAMNYLQVNENLLGSKDSANRVLIKEATDGLREALAEHARVVLRMKAVAEGLVNKISEEVDKKNRRVPTYAPSAAIIQSRQTRPTSIALNEVV